MKRLILIVALGAASACNGPTPGPDVIQTPAVWITASWSGGRTTTPLDEKSQEPQYWDGQLCHADTIVLDNYNYSELLKLRLLTWCPPGTNVCSSLVIHNNCSIPVSVWMCLASGSGGRIPPGANLHQICATDPQQTSPENMLPAVLPPGMNDPISETSPNLTLDLFYCGNGDTLVGPPLKCQQLP